MCFEIQARKLLSFHRGCGCPVPEGVQGQVGLGPAQPDLSVGNHVHGREGYKK